jgi:glutathione S-transferase
MFMLERGVEVPVEDVDIVGGENLSDEYRARNPSAQSPCLELDDGTVLAEVTAIAAYFDETSEGPSLIGETPEERAETRMWNRRLDTRILEPMTLGFRSAEGLPIFENRYHVIPHAADDLKATVRENYAWLDGLLEGKDYVCGDRFTLADMQLYCFAAFGNAIGQPVPEDCPNVQAWFTRVSERPSAAASRHPNDMGD